MKGEKIKRIITIVLVILLAAVVIFLNVRARIEKELNNAPPSVSGNMTNAKPVIYLYPEETLEVSVKVENVDFTVTYPEHGDGWHVTAEPDGTLTNLADGGEYSYLFWEGKSDVKYDFSKGFCVKGKDTAKFLREALSTLGLTPREYNEFIVFWLPFMLDNEYNVISFQYDCYTDNAVLSVTPEPDTVLRVFMAFYESDEYVNIPEQKLEYTERKGFTVVEWGGAKK